MGSVSEGPGRVQGGVVMLARQRQTLILERVRETGAVRVADLVRELGVSDMTVRRDLEILDERGLLEKVHGGATALGAAPSSSPAFAAKSSLQHRRRKPSPTRPRPWSNRGWRSASRPAPPPTPWRSGSPTSRGLTVVTNSGPRRRRALPGRPARPDDHPDRRGPDAVGGPGRAVRGGRAAHGPHGPGLRRGPRHGAAFGVHLPEPPGGGDRPGAHRGRPAARGRRRPHRSGGSSASAPSPGSTRRTS